MAEPLFFFDGDDHHAALAAVARGERVVAFSEAAAGLLQSSSVPFIQASEALGDDPEMPLYRAAADWTKGFGTRAVDAGGQTLKDALRYRSTSLWWWAELYLHHNTEAAQRVRFLETVSCAFKKYGASRISTHDLTEDETLLVERFCASSRVSFAGGRTAGETGASSRSALTVSWMQAMKVVATALKRAGGDHDRLFRRSIVFVSHAAFWRTRISETGQEESYEHYLDALLSESKRRGLQVLTLGVGPQSTFRNRSTIEKWKERLDLKRDDRYVPINRFVTPAVAAGALKAFGWSLGVRHRFRNAPSLSAAFFHRGVAFDDLSRNDLELTLLHQVPWAARSLLEFEAAFSYLDPQIVGLYAESSGLGRAAVEAARSLRIRTLGVQHGILYPNYFSYERTEEDLTSGSPIPDVTAVYGDDGVRLLETEFRYPKGRVVATGSPTYDALAARVQSANRDERRKDLGLREGESLVVLASRYTGIRDTHKAAGPAFAGLLSAISRIEGARLIVKPHPAEPAQAYDRDIAEAGPGLHVSVVANVSLTDLLIAADVLVTVESLSATEALVAGVPVAVLRHPSNLRALVASGAAIGVKDGEDPRSSIEALLNDPLVRERWRRSRDAFLEDVAHGVDGRALDRLVRLISESAGVN